MEVGVSRTPRARDFSRARWSTCPRGASVEAASRRWRVGRCSVPSDRDSVSRSGKERESSLSRLSELLPNQGNGRRRASALRDVASSRAGVSMEHEERARQGGERERGREREGGQ